VYERGSGGASLEARVDGPTALQAESRLTRKLGTTSRTAHPKKRRTQAEPRPVGIFGLCIWAVRLDPYDSFPVKSRVEPYHGSSGADNGRAQ